MTANQVLELLNEKGVYPDKLFKGTREGQKVYIARFGFFYRFGNTEETFAEKVSVALDAKIITAIENYQRWPKDSYWEISFQL